MRSYLISDNEDAVIGMKTAGVDGMIITGPDEILKKIDELVKDKEIGIVLLTRDVMRAVEAEVMDRKLQSKHTLIVEIPSPGQETRKDFITRYIRESIGLKL